MTFDVRSGNRLATCATRGAILDANDTAEIVLESVATDDELLSVDALHVSACTRVSLGRYHRDESPTITGTGSRAGVTRVRGGPLQIVDTSTGKVVEVVPTPPCSTQSCSFRTGSGGALLKNGISVEWHGAAVWCESLPGRTADACASYLGPNANDVSYSNGSLLEGSFTLQEWGRRHWPRDHLLGAAVRGSKMLVLVSPRARATPTEIVVARWPSGEVLSSGMLDPPGPASAQAVEWHERSMVNIALSPDGASIAIGETNLRIVKLEGGRWVTITVLPMGPEPQ